MIRDKSITIDVPDTFQFAAISEPIRDSIPAGSSGAWAKAYAFLLQEKSFKYGMNWIVQSNYVHIPDLKEYSKHLEFLGQDGLTSLVDTLLRIIAEVSMEEVIECSKYYKNN